MNAELLLEHFHRLGGTPDAVPRLRRFVLDLAVRGRLVEQDEKDEPVDCLLDWTRQEMLRLVAKKGLKAVGALEEIDDNAVPFKVPQGWRIVRMGWLAKKLGAGSTPLGGKTVYQAEGIPFLRSQNVHDDGLRLDDVALIPRTVHERMSGTHIQENDILLNITGASIGRCALVPHDLKEGNVSQHVAIIRLFDPSLREFIHLSLRSPFFQKVIDDVQVGVSREGLSMQGLKKFPMLIPPLAEQHRIVAKVDELMALCDRLEAAQQQRESHRTRFTAATWQQLVADPEPQAARFALKQLPALTTRKEQIPALRQAILDLAVRGKLVGPALYPDRSIPWLSFSAEPIQIKESEQPFAVPARWRWGQLDTVADCRAGTKVAPLSIAPDSWVLDLEDIDGETGSVINRAMFSDRSSKSTKASFDAGDVLYGKLRPYLNKVVVADGPGYCTTEIIPIRPKAFLTSTFLRYFLRSAYFLDYAAKRNYGMKMPRLGTKDLETTLVPVPPPQEQTRIVAKVDELMALCDRLEAALEKGETAKAKLHGAVLQLETTSAPPQMRQHPATGKAKPQQATYPLPGDALPMAAEPEGERRGPGRPRKAKADGRSATEQAIFGFLKAHPGWHGKNTILEAAGVAANGWNAAIKSLLESGAVERQGEKKGARYRIV